jgi:hypothetical protein
MTTRHHLTTIATRWTDLHDALTTTGTGTWPPAGRMTDYLAGLDAADAEEVAARWALRDLERSPEQLGETRAPIRLHIHDTMRTVEAALVELADQIAADVQRPVIAAPINRGWSDEIHRTVALLSAKDSADTRRWGYVGTDRRTAPYAALWLLGRHENTPGPFRKLTLAHADRIDRTAAEAAARVEQALQLTRHSQTLTETCACGGQLHLDGGDGTPAAIRCPACGRRIAEQLAA